MNSRLAIFSLVASLAVMSAAQDSADIDARWDYNNPAASELRFRELLARITDSDSRLQVQTQLARAVHDRNVGACRPRNDLPMQR